jgi:hypothetical protein
VALLFCMFIARASFDGLMVHSPGTNEVSPIRQGERFIFHFGMPGLVPRSTSFL